MALPKILITMGDPSGIGPEIIVDAYINGLNKLDCIPVVIGHRDYLYSAALIKNITIKVISLNKLSDIKEDEKDSIYCIDLNVDTQEIQYGINSKFGGEFAYQCIKKAVSLTSRGEAQAICTAPISKVSLHMAGYSYPGHTEMLADLTNTNEVSLMLMSPKLNVIHVTAHVGLIDAINNIDSELIFRTIKRGRKLIKNIIGKEPRIGVCAINPHAGENGAFGHNEEKIKIIPAILQCKDLKWDIHGPLAADSLFFTAARGDFNLVVAMYHDQGHGPIKVLGLEYGVNVTIGLPIIRTSVDHGTAFDIAGKGIANSKNLYNAVAKALALIKDGK